MGLKLRLGLAISGLLMSSMFGVDMLTGIKDYVDTTGNIMVDIADGIGMISKGLEYLETYLDPEGHPSPAVQPNQEDSEVKPPPGGTPVPVQQPLGGTPAPVQQPPVPTVFHASELDPEQPAVLCQGTKCYPYDPNKVKNSKLTLEAKPGMILTPQQPQQTDRQTDRSQQTDRQTDRSQQTDKSKHRKGQNKEEESNSRKHNHKQARSQEEPIKPLNKNEIPISKYTKNQQQNQPSSKTAEPTAKTTQTTQEPQQIIPEPPSIKEHKSVNNNNNNEDKLPVSAPSNNSTSNAKKIITASRGLLDNLSKLLVRLVNRMFPWNRRARRRLEGDDEEL